MKYVFNNNKALIRMNNEYNAVETQLKLLCYSENKKGKL